MVLPPEWREQAPSVDALNPNSLQQSAERNAVLIIGAAFESGKVTPEQLERVAFGPDQTYAAAAQYLRTLLVEPPTQENA